MSLVVPVRLAVLSKVLLVSVRMKEGTGVLGLSFFRAGRKNIAAYCHGLVNLVGGLLVINVVLLLYMKKLSKTLWWYFFC